MTIKSHNKIIKYNSIITLLFIALFLSASCMRTSEVADDKHFDRKDGVYVLCYHGFFNHPDQIIFSLKQLDLHMGTLQKGGFNFISMEDFIAKKYKGLNNVLITSDDGNKSVYKAYYEVFKKYNIKPLIAIYPAITSNRHYALTWEQIAELHKEGCYIAAHGYHHLFLDEKAYRNDPKASVTEVVKSKQVLESKLGFEIDTFVYPYGKRCREVIKIVEETGYKFGFTIEKSINYRNDPNIHQLEMPRYMVMKSNVNEIFELMFKSINKDYEPNPELM